MVVIARHKPLMKLRIKLDDIFRRCVPNHVPSEKDDDLLNSNFKAGNFGGGKFCDFRKFWKNSLKFNPRKIFL